MFVVFASAGGGRVVVELEELEEGDRTGPGPGDGGEIELGVAAATGEPGTSTAALLLAPPAPLPQRSHDRPPFGAAVVVAVDSVVVGIDTVGGAGVPDSTAADDC